MPPTWRRPGLRERLQDPFEGPPESAKYKHNFLGDTSMTADELLTVPQAAGYLGIRAWTLRHWISDHKIEVVKYGNGLVRIRRSVLDRYVASCTIKARASHGRNTKESRLLEGSSLEPGAESLA